MADVKETSCRLCLKNIIDESFDVTDNSIRDILDVLLLKLKFDNESKEVICNVCRRKLNAASEFKSTCMNTDKAIIPYVDSEKMLQLDLREVYMQEKKSELVSISCSQKICRLCMQPVESEFRCISEEELEAIEKLAPEMNINIIKDPVVCKQCLDSLCTHNSFLTDCLEVEEKIKNTFDCLATESRIDTSSLDLLVKTGNLDKEFHINEMEMSIKVESIDIKLEDEERSDTPLQSRSIVPFEESDCKGEEEDGCKRENASKVKTKQERIVLYKCDNCIYETESEIRFSAHCARHENNLEAYNKCESCGYKPKSKKLLQMHLLKHKYPSEVKMYRCNDCDYETKYKNVIEQHQLKHKDPSQVEMYKCNSCMYETRHKRNIQRHQLSHKEPSQVQMYRCTDCNYETKYKYIIKNHQLKHKEPSQVQMYKCNDCDFESKYKNTMKRHQLKHKDPSHVQMYKCNDCDYETIYKYVIRNHQLKHKDPSQVQVYRCNDCNYETELKGNIKNHQLKHKDEKMLQLDLRDVYMLEKESKLVNISSSQRICRLCMHPVETEFRCIREEELEAIQKFTPEMNINIIKDPVVCKPCFDSLCTHNSFLKDWSEVEEKIKSTFDSSATGSQISTPPLDLFVKTENLGKEFDINEMKMSIKAECVDIKSEDEEKSDTPLQSSDMVPFVESACKDEEEDGYKHENGSEMKTKQEGKVLYKCDKCIYETRSEIHFTAHFVRHENDSEVYKCELCEYKTENEKSLKRHLLRHKDHSKCKILAKMEGFKSDKCGCDTYLKYVVTKKT
ncbi:zinc finger protein 729-like [Anoplophora glabripennis]|uniref:zinc finger protein 729-like n=1 Tax=Anoplophora glabripennis TaxID=217634 RepID=UPI000C769E32|nr:zinc finger protein 729-like [Anoplophora glabripennis]